MRFCNVWTTAQLIVRLIAWNGKYIYFNAFDNHQYFKIFAIDICKEDIRNY